MLIYGVTLSVLALSLLWLGRRVVATAKRLIVILAGLFITPVLVARVSWAGFRQVFDPESNIPQDLSIFVGLISFTFLLIGGLFMRRSQPLSLADQIDKITELEQIRILRRYKPAWLYHRCAEEGFMEGYLYLREMGELGGRADRPYVRSESDKGRESTARPDSGSEAASSAASEPDSYEILGLTRGATAQEIKSAARRLFALYHPDKVNHLGEDLKNLAHERTLQIQAAYEKLAPKG